MSAIAKFATEELGFTADELKGVRDHRVIKLLRMAQQSHAASKKKVIPAQVREKTEKEVLPPTRAVTERKPMSKQTRALLAHAQSKTVKSARTIPSSSISVSPPFRTPSWHASVPPRTAWIPLSTMPPSIVVP